MSMKLSSRMKAKVPPPNESDLDTCVPKMTQMEVALSESRMSMLLGFWGSTPKKPDTVVTYAMSPPAAALLARALQSAVDEHLYQAVPGDVPKDVSEME